MNTTWATEQISDSLRSTVRASINEYCSTVFSLIGVTEENGVGLSGGGRQPNSPAHAYVKGKRKYTRLLIKFSALQTTEDM